MSRTAIVAGVAALTVGAAVLLPLPAQSSAPVQPPRMPSFAGDVVIPPEGTPKTRMPRYVHEHGSITYKQGIYDVHILVVATDDGPAPWDEAEARRRVEQMDAWFAEQTRGLFRFRLGGYQMLPPYPGQLCGLKPAMEHAALEVRDIRPSSGATDALPVVVALWPEDCWAAGQANLGSPGTWVSEDAAWPDRTDAVLVHEVGHNLGLEHSGSVDPDAGVANPWSAGGMPKVIEYGDGTDVMGSGSQWRWNGVSYSHRPSGLHAHNMNLLGVLDADEIGMVSMPAEETSVTLDLVPVTTPGSGMRAVYLPWFNRSKFFVEYRTASGSDGWLDVEGGAGSGVVVRLVDTDLSTGPEPYPKDTTETVYFGTIAWPMATPVRQDYFIPVGMKQGGTTRLTEGTTVEVLSADTQRATVRITRPADTTPPVMSTPRIEYAGGACTRYPCKLPVTASKKGKYRLWLTYGGFTDDQWVSSVTATVNGAEALADERPSPDGTDEEGPMSPGSRYWGAWRTYAPGNYTVTYTYMDLSGNEGTSSYQIVLPKPKSRR